MASALPGNKAVVIFGYDYDEYPMEPGIAAFETPTKGFTLVNASLTWRPLPETRHLSLTLAADNIFDVDARRHASFTKDYVPLAGRDIRITARASF